MVLRPPIARGLRFSHRYGSWTEHGKSSNRANVFFHEIAVFWGAETPSLLQKQQIAMSLRQRLGESREGARGALRIASQGTWSRCGQPCSAALRSQLFSVPPVAAMDSPAAIRAREDADLGLLADRADPE
jgi:hypothetical protein